MNAKECQRKSKWQYPDSEPVIRGQPMAPRWKGSEIHYAPSARPISIRRQYTVIMHRNWGPENKHEHKKGTMDQQEKRYGKENWLRKRNRTVQRNIGMEKTTEKYQRSRWRWKTGKKKKNQRRCPWIINLKNNVLKLIKKLKLNHHLFLIFWINHYFWINLSQNVFFHWIFDVQLQVSPI
jgi:hypothetical protein